VTGFERAVVGATTWSMAITGAAFFWMKYMMTGDDPFSVIHHPWQPHALSLHVLGGPAAVFALGLIARSHILERLMGPRPGRGRATGIVLLALAVPMIASGYLMQVLTAPDTKRVLVGVHVAAGGLYTLLFVGHLVASRKTGRALNGPGGRVVAHRRTMSRRLDPRGRRGIALFVRPPESGAPAGREGMKP
jgi:hypothetical protein